ncbi:DUF1659 domain-containing protein [Virgibacillus xinjiangensis]|uniref:DUF1659 domain-containing protein n=1 Tax=Virgibacillus xinjiangensis TaxID=393090 RepID=A0ABV7CY60_9BACI
MAQAIKIDSTLRLILREGTDLETGKDIYRTKSFTNVKIGTTPEQLYPIANALVGLQQLPLYLMEIRDTSLLSE